MAALTVQDVSLAGLAESLVAASVGGDTIADAGKQDTFLEVVNGSGGSINVTIDAVETSKVVAGVGPVTIADKVIAVADGARKLIGPFPNAYRTPQGVVNVAYSAVTSVTVRALRVTKIDG